MLQPEKLNPYLTFSCDSNDIFTEFYVGMKSLGIIKFSVLSLSRDNKYKSLKVT